MEVKPKYKRCPSCGEIGVVESSFMRRIWDERKEYRVGVYKCEGCKKKFQGRVYWFPTQ